MPFGYLVSVALMAVCVAVAVHPPRPRETRPSSLSFWLGFLVNELPFVALGWLAVSTAQATAEGDLATPVGTAAAGLALVAAAGLGVIVRRALGARAEVERALDEGVGPGWRRAAAGVPGRRRRPWARIVLWPFPWWVRPGRRVAGIRYGPDRRRNVLDAHRPRHPAAGGPVLVHLHGGAFRSGRRNRDAQPLINRLVRRGWLCLDADYRLSPQATFPDHLVDAKRVIAWARTHAADYGADPDRVVVSGSSAGAHLAAIAALTANDPRFQPGFEDADTTTSAAVALYPYTGAVTTTGPPSSPHDHVHEGAPPFFIAHGDHDTLVVVDDARRFAEHLGAVSAQPVVYAELAGGQHCFDLFHSVRFEAVVDGIEAFTALSPGHGRPPPS